MTTHPRRYLLDTSIVSELRRKRCDVNVAKWVGNLKTDDAFLSVVTIGEIAKGIAKRRRTELHAAEADDLQAWLDGLLAMYADRILAVDIPIATRWGRLCDAHPQRATDMLLAATALEHGLTVATRNTPHFKVAGEETVDPFAG